MRVLLLLATLFLASSLAVSSLDVSSGEVHLSTDDYSIDIDNLGETPNIRITSKATNATIFYYDGSEYDLLSEFDMRIAAEDTLELDSYSTVFHTATRASFLTGAEGMLLSGGPFYNQNNTYNKHYASVTLTPTILFGLAACSPTSTSISGNDHNMKIKFTTSSPCTVDGEVATITFAAPFSDPSYGNNLAKTVNCFPCNAASTYYTDHLYVDESDLTTSYYVLSTHGQFWSSTAYCFYCNVGA